MQDFALWRFSRTLPIQLNLPDNSKLQRLHLLAFRVLFREAPNAWGSRSGCHLSETATVAVMPAVAAAPLTVMPAPKPKHTMLPVLIVLFLVSYGLMCLLVVEQGTTIDNQRFLIRQLLGDSTQLSAMKGKANMERQAQAKAQAQAQAQANAQAHQGPSANERNGKSHKMRRPAPPKPPTDTSDTVDERRTLISI